MQRGAVPRVFRILFCAVMLVVQVAAGVAAGAPGALRIGTSADYAPFSFRDTAGNLTGFDITVARRLASDLGRQVDFVPFRWPDLVAQLEGGTFDVAMNGVTIRPDRAVSIGYTRPYVVTGAVAVIRASDRQRYRGVADLDHAGVRIGVNAGGHLQQVALRQFTHAHVAPVSDNRALPDLLQRGEVEAVISEQFEPRTWSGKQFVILGAFTRDRKAYALAPTATDLLQQINDWLAAREADRWLGDRASLTPAQAGFEALVAAIDLRLQLMPFVAAVKRRERLPIEDSAQEARVLERVRTAAAAHRLGPDDVAEVFRVQIEAAKAVERSAPAPSVPAHLSLEAVARCRKQGERSNHRRAGPLSAVVG